VDAVVIGLENVVNGIRYTIDDARLLPASRLPANRILPVLMLFALGKSEVIFGRYWDH
jgi:hypothetical protein